MDCGLLVTCPLTNSIELRSELVLEVPDDAFVLPARLRRIVKQATPAARLGPRGLSLVARTGAVLSQTVLDFLHVVLYDLFACCFDYVLMTHQRSVL